LSRAGDQTIFALFSTPRAIVTKVLLHLSMGMILFRHGSDPQSRQASSGKRGARGRDDEAPEDREIVQLVRGKPKRGSIETPYDSDRLATCSETNKSRAQSSQPCDAAHGKVK